MKVILLAGGEGTRLWPVSRPQLPKQFLSFHSSDTLLQQTIRRFLALVPKEDILIVTNKKYEEIAKKQADEVHTKLKNSILVEPESKNTAAAITYALRHLLDVKNCNPDSLFLVSPTDHFITPLDSFLETLHLGKSFYSKGTVLFGVRPTGPDEGYGYMEVENSGKGMYSLQRFLEKPSFFEAKNLFLSSHILWNSGIFLDSALAFLNKLYRLGFCYAAQEFCFLKQSYAALPRLSIEEAYFEKLKDGIVFPLQCTWSDIGTWERLYECLKKDENQNVKRGNVSIINSKNCMILSDKKKISTIDIEDLFIIDSEKELFICKKGSSKKRIKDQV